MSGLAGFDVFFNGVIPTVRLLLAEWNPGPLESERKFQDSLHGFLQAKLPDCIVRREYPEAGCIVDIYLKRPGFWGDEEVFFELKHDLSDKPEFNRLVGQLMDMEPSKRKIVVVLCGKTERSIVQRLHHHFKDQINDEFSRMPPYHWQSEPQMTIVVK